MTTVDPSSVVHVYDTRLRCTYASARVCAQTHHNGPRVNSLRGANVAELSKKGPATWHEK